MISYLYDIFAGDVELSDVILEFCVIVFVWACCLPVHESAHAWMADRLGDPTGRLSGRISLNPMRHLSLVGTLLMLTVGFGYAKPVPVNIRNFKKQKKYFALTSLAGPVSNLLLAFIFSFVANIAYFVVVKTGLYENTTAFVTIRFFSSVAYVNIALAVFNMIPIPPLDGSRLVSMVLPDRIYYKLLSYERYIIYGLFVLIFMCSRIGISPVGFFTEYIYLFVDFLTRLPFRFFI